MFEQFERVVRCSDGHLYETLWVPLISFKSLRLGMRRYQRCPLDGHWTTVEPVDERVLPPEMLAAARSVHDVRIP